jgi:hypothetical protein
VAQYPDSPQAPEAFYFRGVSKYKCTDKAEPLKEASDILRAFYPNSEWSKKAVPYQLL